MSTPAPFKEPLPAFYTLKIRIKLAKKGLTLASWCREKNFDYQQTIQTIFALQRGRNKPFTSPNRFLISKTLKNEGLIDED